jgi:phosphate transport system substrate-binding protein
MNSSKSWPAAIIFLGLNMILHPAGGADAPAAPIPLADYYCPDRPVAGQLTLVGSETMSQLAALWYHRFQQIHPEVRIPIEPRGSEAVMAGLTEDPTRIGMISRPLTNEEHQRLEQQLGMRVATIVVGYDVLAVVVHSQNPVPAFSRDQGSRLLASTTDSSTPTWSELGVEGDWGSLPISMHGYTEQSGTRTFLRQFLLGGADGRAVDQHASHAALVEAVATDRGGVGIVSLSRVRPDKVRVVPVIGTDGRLVLPTDEQAVADGRYPLVRPLMLVIPFQGDALQEPLRMEFVKYVLSREGQADVAKDGFLPLDRNDLLLQQDRLGWNTAK